MAFWDRKQNKPTHHESSFDDFNTKNWNKLSENERLDALQYLEDQMAIEQGRAPRQVDVDYTLKSGQCGYYTSKDPSHLYINQEYLQASKNGSQYDAMNTVIHEGRHAYQDDCVQHRISRQESPETVELWRKNFDNDVYHEPGNGIREKLNYRFQPIEEDANNFAQSKMEHFSDKFDADRNYLKYMENENRIHVLEDRAGRQEIGSDYKETISDSINQRYEAKHQLQESQGVQPHKDDTKTQQIQNPNAQTNGPNTTESANQAQSVERGQKPTSSETNNDGIHKLSERGQKPQETQQKADSINTEQTQRGRLPDAVDTDTSRAPTSVSSNPGSEVSSGVNSAKAADEASKIAANDTRNTVSKAGLGV